MADGVKISELAEIHSLQANDKFVVESAKDKVTKAVPYHDLLSTGNVSNGLGLSIEPKHRQITTTLEPGSWVDGSPFCTYTINIDQLTATQMVYVCCGMNLTEEQLRGFANSCITAMSQEKGKIKLKALKKPAVSLPIVIELGGEES